MKFAVLFPGQGSQYVGMGKDLYERFSSTRELFKRADEVLSFPLTDLIFNGPEEELKKTFNAQPAIFLLSYAIWKIFEEKVLSLPSFLAGHSLGEYTALCASSFFSFEDAIRIVRKRGLFMEEAFPSGKGGMVALIDPKMEEVVRVIKEVSREDRTVTIANINAPDQIVLSGYTEVLKEAVERLKGSGCKRAVFLNVSGPFHSPYMKEAAGRLREELRKIKVSSMRFPVVFNVDAEPFMDGHLVFEKLEKQLYSPVLWKKSIERIHEEGVQIFIELGPRSVLTNLVKRILPSSLTINIEKIEDFDKLNKLGE